MFHVSQFLCLHSINTNSSIFVVAAVFTLQRYKYATGRELEKAREQDKSADDLTDEDFDSFSALLRGLTNRCRRYTLPPE